MWRCGMVFLLLFAGIGFTQTIDSDGYQFNIEAKNRWGKPIENFKSKVKIKNGEAKIEVRALGYIITPKKVPLQDGQTDYDVIVVMRDPWIDIDVRNTRGEIVSTLDVEKGHAVSSKEYRVEISIMEFNYSNFTSWDVEVEVDHWPIFGADVEVYGSAFNRRLVLTLPRAVFKYSYRPNLLIEIPKDGHFLVRSRKEKSQKLNFQIQNHQELQELPLLKIQTKLNALKGLMSR